MNIDEVAYNQRAASQMMKTMLMNNFLRFLAAAGLSFWALTVAATAADIKYLGTNKNIYTSYGYQPTTHVFVLSGQIERGDSDKIRATLSGKLQITTVFCETEKPAVVFLNSPGGNFSEGLKLAKLFRSMGVGTIVKSGDRCLSACAVSFLGGTRELCLDGDRGPYRRLQPGAVLGFHAPRLIVPSRNYTQAQIAQSYDVAVKQIGRLVGEFKLVGIPSSLIVEMLKVGANDFFYIDTVGKAGRWKFDVAVADTKKLSRRSLVTACANAESWSNDSFHPSADFEDSPELVIVDRFKKNLRVFVQATGMYAKSCFVEMSKWPNTGRNKYWVKFFDESIQSLQKMYKQRSLEAGSVVLTPLHFYPPELKLSDLPTGQ